MDSSLERLIEKTRRVGTGDLAGPLEISCGDEFSELATALNQMCEHLSAAREQVGRDTDARIAALEQLHHADRLTTVGRLASGTAHELGTPMNVVSVRAELIIEASPSDDAVASAKIIKAQVDKMAGIIRQLLDFARRRLPRKERADLSRLTEQSTQLVGALAASKQLAIKFSSSGPLVADVDPGQIQQALTNLLVNAIQAMPKGGTIEVSVDRQRDSAGVGRGRDAQGDFARIDVRDEGIGISPDNLRKIFDPFFTTKEVGEGTGMGLSIAYGIVQDHGGWIDVESIVGQGSRFSIFLPLADVAPPRTTLA